MTIRIRTDVAAGHVSAYQLHWLSGLAGRVGLAPGRGLDPAGAPGNGGTRRSCVMPPSLSVCVYCYWMLSASPDLDGVRTLASPPARLSGELRSESAVSNIKPLSVIRCIRILEFQIGFAIHAVCK